MDQMEDNTRVAKPEVLLAWLIQGVFRSFICCFLSQMSADVLQLCAHNKQKLQVYLPQAVRVSSNVVTKDVFTGVTVVQVLTIKGKKESQKYACHPALTVNQKASVTKKQATSSIQLQCR
jgi:hypothetical protein